MVDQLRSAQQPQLGSLRSLPPKGLAEPLLSVADLAELLATSVAAVYHDVARGHVPQPIRLGARLRWRPETIRAWLTSLEEEAGQR